MKEANIYMIIAGIVLIFFIYQSVKYRKNERIALRKRLKERFGNVPVREYEFAEFEKITHYHKHFKDNEGIIDDITWNDLNMDSIFMLINNTNSSAGEEYLYRKLRKCGEYSEDAVEFDKLVSYFEENEERALKYSEIFSGLGRTKSISLYDFLFKLGDLGKRSSVKHYILLIIFIASVISLFIIPEIGIAFMVLSIGYNVFDYFKEKSKIDSYFICFRYLVSMINSADCILSETIDNEAFNEINTELKSCIKELSSLRRGIFMLTSNDMSGSIGEIIMEYVRMLTHVDLIKFNSMLNLTNHKTDTVDLLFQNLGRLESAIAVASFRKMLPYYCKPEFVMSDKCMVEFEDIYHPMIKDPVSNSIKEENCILITGSNASGKSTFLKTFAINAILAETIYTCTAKKYKANYFQIYSSMALHDNLEGNESYYIVEIKSLKRILDRVGKDTHILCFVDEVLRGTNTVERIAASTQILKMMADNNVLCCAATHDIELAQILEKYYSNYHFAEEVMDSDVKFNYRLNFGKATSRNAIKLLRVMGFDENIVKHAENMASEFIEDGIWKNA